jgi:flagellar biosynthesis/type III secretory pathway protein FliH
MTREEIVEGLKLLEDNMVHFDELQNDKGEWIDVHELLFETIKALSQEPCKVMDHAIKAYRQGYENGLGKAQTDSYVKGYEDGQKEKPQAIYEMKVEEYNKGLNEAWECARKISMPENEGGMSVKALQSIFGKAREIFNCTASEAIQKIKEYEEKQKQTEEIKVGYEVYNIDRENKRIVTAIDGNKAIQLCSNGKYTVDNIDTLHWTGREDLRIKKVLENIKNEV